MSLSPLAAMVAVGRSIGHPGACPARTIPALRRPVKGSRCQTAPTFGSSVGRSVGRSGGLASGRPACPRASFNKHSLFCQRRLIGSWAMKLLESSAVHFVVIERRGRRNKRRTDRLFDQTVWVGRRDSGGCRGFAQLSLETVRVANVPINPSGRTLSHRKPSIAAPTMTNSIRSKASFVRCAYCSRECERRSRQSFSAVVFRRFSSFFLSARLCFCLLLSFVVATAREKCIEVTIARFFNDR